MIRLKDALLVMEDKSMPFSIDFITYDKKRKTGGKIISLTNCETVGSQFSQGKNAMRNIKQRHHSSHPYPVHIWLILKFNDQKVI